MDCRWLRILALGNLYRVHWPAVTGKVPFTLAEVDRANDLATQIGEALGVRDRTSPEVVRAVHHRQAAYTLLFRTWARKKSRTATLIPTTRSPSTRTSTA